MISGAGNTARIIGLVVGLVLAGAGINAAAARGADATSPDGILSGTVNDAIAGIFDRGAAAAVETTGNAGSERVYALNAWSQNFYREYQERYQNFYREYQERYQNRLRNRLRRFRHFARGHGGGSDDEDDCDRGEVSPKGKDDDDDDDCEENDDDDDDDDDRSDQDHDEDDDRDGRGNRG